MILFHARCDPDGATIYTSLKTQVTYVIRRPDAYGVVFVETQGLTMAVNSRADAIRFVEMADADIPSNIVAFKKREIAHV